MNASHDKDTAFLANEMQANETQASDARRREAVAEALEPDFCIRFATQILELEAINGRGQTLTTSAERTRAHLQEVRRRYEESSIHDPRSAHSQNVDLRDAEQAIVEIMLQCLVVRSEAWHALKAVRASCEKAMQALAENAGNPALEFNRLRVNVICNRKAVSGGQRLIASIDQLEHYIAAEEILLRYI